ncbi:MAG: biopolymer transporter ExbD [Pseudomonadota bacterium]
MAFGGQFHEGGDGDNAEINMIPLIDVMLVLLVIFIITAPLMTHAVKVDLPVASSQPSQEQPDAIQLAIKADGTLYWNAEAVDAAALQARMAAAGRQSPQPEVHLLADGELAYKHLARVMADASRAGLGKLAFVTTPDATP